MPSIAIPFSGSLNFADAEAGGLKKILFNFWSSEALGK